MIVLGITGTNGAGKGTIVNYLVKKKGFKHFSVRKLLSQELKKNGLNNNRLNLIAIANELRKNNGPSYLAETLYKRAKKSGKDSVIESLRNTKEVLALRKKGNFYLFAVYAEPRLRYERIMKRGAMIDKKTFKDFIETEQKEMASKKSHEENMLECIRLADYGFLNNGTFEELYNQVETALKEVYREIESKS